MNWSGKCERPGEGDRWGALCTKFTLVDVSCSFIGVTNGINGYWWLFYW